MAKKKENKKAITDLEALKKANEKLIADLKKLQETGLLLQNISRMTHYHLESCLEKTGVVLQEDLDYCKMLGLRILDHSSKKS